MAANGLTHTEIDVIKSSWAPIRRQATDSGVKLFMLLFERFPQYQDLFPFRGVPLGELATQKRFKAHVVGVVYGLSAIVDSLEDEELLVAILNKVGSSHVPRKVTEQAYWDLKEVILELFATLMGGEEVETWRKLLDVAIPHIIDGHRSYGNE